MPEHGVGELPTSHSRARAVWGGCVGFTAPTLQPLPMGCPSATAQQSRALTPMSILIRAFQVQGWHQDQKVVTFILEILNCLAFFIIFFLHTFLAKAVCQIQPQALRSAGPSQ